MSDLESKVGSIIKIAYCPQFSVGFKAFVKNYVNVAMNSDETKQYNVELIEEEIEGMKFEISQEDRELLGFLYKEKGVEYIEF
jgi:hypothetical protein